MLAVLFSPALGSQPRIAGARSRKQQRGALSHAPAAARREPPLGTGAARPPPPPPLLPFPGQPAALRSPCRDRGRLGWLAGGASLPRSRGGDPRHGPKAITWRWWPPAASKARCSSARRTQDVPRWLQDFVTPSSCRAEGLNPGWAQLLSPAGSFLPAEPQHVSWELPRPLPRSRGTQMSSSFGRESLGARLPH